MGYQFSQFFPPKPTFTGVNLEPQNGKVFIVTGGYSGIGLELVKMLYSAHGRIYIAGRSKDKADAATKDIQSSSPESKGSLEFLHVELDNLSTIKASADDFLARESKLHVLWNNAGVSQPPLGSVSKQGIELQLATNVLGPFLFTKLLLPLLERTSAAAETAKGSVRVVWASSQIVELQTPPGGLVVSELRDPPKDQGRNYVNSKLGNWFLSAELAHRYPYSSSGILSVAHNPGAASTNLFRHTPLVHWLAWPLMHSVRYAACTELFAGMSPDVTMSGSYVVPFGKLAADTDIKPELCNAMKREDEQAGTGKAKELWDWCEEVTGKYC